LNGVSTRFNQLSAEEFHKTLPATVSKEIQESLAFNEEFGWDGGEPGVLRPSDVSIFLSDHKIGDSLLNYSFAAKIRRTSNQCQGMDQGARLVSYH
jgi:hypothetical protein